MRGGSAAGTTDPPPPACLLANSVEDWEPDFPGFKIRSATSSKASHLSATEVLHQQNVNGDSDNNSNNHVYFVPLQGFYFKHFGEHLVPNKSYKSVVKL